MKMSKWRRFVLRGNLHFLLAVVTSMVVLVSFTRDVEWWARGVTLIAPCLNIAFVVYFRRQYRAMIARSLAGSRYPSLSDWPPDNKWEDKP